MAAYGKMAKSGKASKTEIYQTAAMMKKHENSEGKKIVAMEKSRAKKMLLKLKKPTAKK